VIILEIINDNILSFREPERMAIFFNCL